MGALVSPLGPPLRAWPGQGGSGQGSREAPCPVPTGSLEAASRPAPPSPPRARAQAAAATRAACTGVPGLPGLHVPAVRVPWLHPKVAIRSQCSIPRQPLAGALATALPAALGPRLRWSCASWRSQEVHSLPEVPPTPNLADSFIGSWRFCGEKGGRGQVTVPAQRGHKRKLHEALTRGSRAAPRSRVNIPRDARDRMRGMEAGRYGTAPAHCEGGRA